MKTIQISTILLLLSFSSLSQTHNLGIKYIGAPISDDFSEFVSYQYKKNNGFSGVGISYDFYTKRNLTIGTELSYNKFRDYSKVPGKVENGIVLGFDDYKRQFNYISMSLKIGYKINIGKKIFVQPSIGLVNSYLTNANTNYQNRDFDPVKGYRRFDTMGLGGILLGYNITPKIALTGGVRYQFALKDNSKNTANILSPISTNQKQFSIGLSFKLGQK